MTLTLQHPNSPWHELKKPRDFQLGNVYVGQGGEGSALTVITAKWEGSGEPTDAALKSLHKLYLGDRATPVVLVVEVDGEQQRIVGHAADWSPTEKVEYSTVARVLQAALDDPSPIAARERIRTLRESLESTALPGIKNSGLFALHELTVGVPSRSDYSAACTKSVPLLGLTGAELVRGLGFKATPIGNNAEVLRGTGLQDLAVAIVLQDTEVFDQPSDRLGGLPIAKGIEIAEKNNVGWIILMRRNKIRLYPARNDLGVGRKGVTQTFLELDLPQLTDANAGYLSLIFSAEALADGGTAFQILESSRQYAVGLGERLRDKVYEEIIPTLSLAVAKSVRGTKRIYTPEMLTKAYDLTLRIFFRILFQVYAEDRKLLPLGENPAFDKKALKTLAREMAKDPRASFSSGSTALWDRLAEVWKAIDDGSKPLGIPAYNGGLFSSDVDLHPESAAIGEISVPDDVMGPVLRALLLDIGDSGDSVPVDFRSLGVREFGTIYEGLLESSLGAAETDLTLDKDKNWVPVKKKSDEVVAPAGSVYFHNTSGQRKGTGSYFTPSFVVEHLLERSLDPALDAHLASVAELVANGDEATATEKFFDFRVADIAMGSGHFLTAAIDHIEKKMAVFLAAGEHPMPGVQNEILELEAAAKEAVGPDGPEIDRPSLLRRQIARRCIYGLDLNPIAVELARVSIWIHTFVRGLPMSSLDHNLVCGNSLTGIGTIDEALDVLNPSRTGKGKGGKRDKHIVSAEEYLIAEVLGDARETLLQASQSLELNKAESRSATRAAKKARTQALKAVRLFDAAVLRRIDRGGLVAADEFDIDGLVRLAGSDEAQIALKPLSPAHMPALFPEVFSRDRAGFDVLVGNPPWEKMHVKEDAWWTKHQPGLLGMTKTDRDKAIKRLRSTNPELVRQLEEEILAKDLAKQAIGAGQFPGIGAAHIDLYSAFAWRNTQLARKDGLLAIVLPKSAWSGSSLGEWRRFLFDHLSISELVYLTNERQWVFEGVDGRYSFCLTIIEKNSSPVVRFSGPFYSLKELRDGANAAEEVPVASIRQWSDHGALPSFPAAISVSIFEKMRLSPPLVAEGDENGVRLSQGDFNITTHRKLFALGPPESADKMPVLGGGSIGLWNADHNPSYGNAKKAELLPWIRSSHQERHAEADYLPIDVARIAIRQISRSTDTRTLLACLVAPEVALASGAHYVSFQRHDPSREAFLLGVLGSQIFDWYARRWVELNVTFELLRPMPIPAFKASDEKCKQIVHCSGLLAAVDKRYAAWAKAVGVPVGSVKTADQREKLLAELDALVAASYALSQSDVQHIFDTFHRNGNYSAHCKAVLSHLKAKGIR